MSGRLEALRGRGDELVGALRALVELESPSADLAATAACARELARLGAGLLGAPPEELVVQGRTHLRWRFGERTVVLLLGHLDTVWPLGTTAAWPFAVEAGVASGPGTADMKGGLVQALFALSTLADLDGVTLLVTSDEELGSPTSARLIEEAASGARAALVLEAALDGAVKTARKGVSSYELIVSGRAAHAGLEPERGVNALVELAHQVLALGRIARPAEGTTVTPTVAGAGTTANTVPDRASAMVDARAASRAEQERVDLQVRALRPVTPGARLEVRGGPNRPPLEPAASAGLFALAARLADGLGLASLRGAAAGGGSDGNLTAALGVPTLDGLGAVGGNLHAPGEHLLVAAMPERAALLAELVEAVRAGGAG